MSKPRKKRKPKAVAGKEQDPIAPDKITYGPEEADYPHIMLAAGWLIGLQLKLKGKIDDDDRRVMIKASNYLQFFGRRMYEYEQEQKVKAQEEVK